MSRPRKVRPRHGDAVEPGMSLRDIAPALGVSKAELQRWRQLAEIPDETFEDILAREDVPRSAEGIVAAAANVYRQRSRLTAIERAAQVLVEEALRRLDGTDNVTIPVSFVLELLEAFRVRWIRDETA
jgi:transposase-like protein